MSVKWSSKWISSKDKAKQRKYRLNAPFHIKRKFLSANVSESLRTKIGKSSVPVRKGDEAIIKRGSYKGTTGEITAVFLKKGTVHIKSVVRKKTDGTEVHVPINPSNLQIISLNLDDPRRLMAASKGVVKKSEAVKKVIKKDVKVKDVAADVKKPAKKVEQKVMNVKSVSKNDDTGKVKENKKTEVVEKIEIEPAKKPESKL
ncbi:MAG: 50S ribosomal protein L24 [archaeon]|nr:50S ribosomal protein L24 [archaeon]